MFHLWRSLHGHHTNLQGLQNLGDMMNRFSGTSHGSLSRWGNPINEAQYRDRNVTTFSCLGVPTAVMSSQFFSVGRLKVFLNIGELKQEPEQRP